MFLTRTRLLCQKIRLGLDSWFLIDGRKGDGLGCRLPLWLGLGAWLIIEGREGDGQMGVGFSQAGLCVGVGFRLE